MSYVYVSELNLYIYIILFGIIHSRNCMPSLVSVATTKIPLQYSYEWLSREDIMCAIIIILAEKYFMLFAEFLTCRKYPNREWCPALYSGPYHSANFFNSLEYYTRFSVKDTLALSGFMLRRKCVKK